MEYENCALPDVSPGPLLCIEYSLKNQEPRRIRYKYRTNGPGWWRIEQHQRDGDWRTIGRELAMNVQWAVCEGEDGRLPMPDPTPSAFELDLFTLVAQQDAWRILMLLTTLEEPVSHTRIGEFLTAFNRGTPAPVEADATYTGTLDTTIAQLDEANVIDDTASGLTRGPRFTEACRMVLPS